MNDEVSEELVDGDEGIINQKLPVNDKKFSVLKNSV